MEIPTKAAKYPLPLHERRRRIENPTYEEMMQDDKRDEVTRNLSRSSR